MSILDRVAARVSRDRAVAAIDQTFAPQATAVLGATAGNGLTRVGGMLSLGVAATAEGQTTLINIGRPAAAIWQPGSVAGVAGAIRNPFAASGPVTTITQPAPSSTHSPRPGRRIPHRRPGRRARPAVSAPGRHTRPDRQPRRRQRHHHRRHRPQRARRQRQRPPLPGACPRRPDHTGNLSWSKVDKAGSALSHLETRPHSALTGIGPDDHHARSHSIVSANDHTLTGAKWSPGRRHRHQYPGPHHPHYHHRRRHPGRHPQIRRRRRPRARQTAHADHRHQHRPEPDPAASGQHHFVTGRQSGAPQRRQSLPHRQLHQRLCGRRLPNRPGRHHRRQNHRRRRTT